MARPQPPLELCAVLIRATLAERLGDVAKLSAGDGVVLLGEQPHVVHTRATARRVPRPRPGVLAGRSCRRARRSMAESRPRSRRRPARGDRTAVLPDLVRRELRVQQEPNNRQRESRGERFTGQHSLGQQVEGRRAKHDPNQQQHTHTGQWGACPTHSETRAKSSSARYHASVTSKSSISQLPPGNEGDGLEHLPHSRGSDPGGRCLQQVAVCPGSVLERAGRFQWRTMTSNCLVDCPRNRFTDLRASVPR